MAAHSVNENVTKDGRTITCEWFNTPLTTDDGQFGGMLCLARDITEQKSLQAQLQQAQKMEAIGCLAGGVAHDFNNLLSVILSCSEMLNRELPGHEELEEIATAGRRAADLTRQLLAFSRRQLLQPRVVDLNDVVVGMEKMLRRLIGETIELSVIRSDVRAAAYVDPGQIEQVIMNLAVNARDAMPSGGTLTVQLAQVDLAPEQAARHAGATSGRHVLLSVTDTGTGMDAATQARIFEPFFTTKEVGKGTGLGLSTVFGIVRQSAGTLSVSSAPGRGSTFRVFLPAVGGALEPSTPNPADPIDLRGSETVLLVDDEEAVRRVTRSILERSGYRVLDAHSGGEALLIAETEPGIDLLVSDVVMPRLSGPQLAARLRTSKPELSVLYVSGYTDNSLALQDAGFLQKPITPRALLSKVREVLDGTERVTSSGGA